MADDAVEEGEEFDEFDDEDRDCWRCGGEGWGIVGVDWEPRDYVNGPYEGAVEKCDCCGGTGIRKDCTYF